MTDELSTPIYSAAHPFGMVGQSAAHQQLLLQLRRIGPHFRTVLLRGERGTGKDLAARALHVLGAGLHAPFLKYAEENRCTDDERSHPAGLFETTAGGTLYLDEVGDLTLDLQAELLKTIQKWDAPRYRLNKPRLVASTSVDLKTHATNGLFRQDLYLRLAMIEIALPPLRTRAEDVVPLAEHFVMRTSDALGIAPPLFDGSAIERLQQHAWPGNVRELETVVSNAVARCTRGTLLAEDFDLLSNAASPDANTRVRLDDVVRRHVRAVLQECAGNKLRAAEMLGISRSTLYRMLDAETMAAVSH
ncbi:MAG: sigma-54-dependent Fis family transcriptional regulator [Acidobacteria bacterium]|nr:sigma-54-dependent Fis family transcriptional regulator [Acidobacteriota bacterium]